MVALGGDYMTLRILTATSRSKAPAACLAFSCMFMANRVDDFMMGRRSSLGG
jgi:hypothetical protein